MGGHSQIANKRTNSQLTKAIRASIQAMSMLAVGAAASAADSTTTLDEVVVTGIRASLEKSISTKREANSIVDAITAEDIGKFPDKNVAEALQRIPGVSIARGDFGEGEHVSIRGTEPKLNRTLLNGHSIATADWFILDEIDGNRSFNYLMLPSESVGSLEVHKSAQADLDEGGIGGTINVHTRKPLDLPEFSFSGSAQYNRNDLADEIEPQLSGVISWHNPEKTFGALFGVVKQKRHVRRDGVEVLGYSDVEVDEQGTTLAVPDLIGPSLFEQTRYRRGGNLTLQWQPNEKFDADFTALYFRMDADNFSNTYMAYGANLLAYHGHQPYNTAADSHGTLVAGQWDAVPADESYYYDPQYGALYDAILREAFTDTTSFDLNANFHPTEDWTIHGQIGLTRGSGATTSQQFMETGALTGFSYDLRGPTPSVQFTDINPVIAAGLSEFALLAGDSLETEDKETYAFINVTRDLNWGVLESIKFGGKYTDHDRDNEFNSIVRTSVFPPNEESLFPRTYCGPNGTTVHDPVATTPPVGYHICGLADVSSGTTPGNFLNRFGGVRMPFAIVDGGRLAALAASLPVGGAGVESNYAYQDPTQTFNIQERTFGGYVMGNFRAEHWRGNAGVRVVKTEEVSEGYIINPPLGTPGIQENYEYGFIAPNRAEHSYTDVLPSANFTYELTSEFLLRATASKVMARPDYSQIQPSLNLSARSFNIRSGNIELDPFRAAAFNVSAEWYFEKASILSLTAFYMDIKNYIVTRSYSERYLTVFDLTPSAAVINRGACTPNAGGTFFYDCTYLVDRPTNGFGGTNKGLEFIFQRPIWGGLGFTLNYTYSDAESDSGEAIPGNSENTANLSVYFENQRLSARVSYNYRSEFFDDIYVGRQVWVDESDYLDASISVNVVEHLALTFEATNLTDEKQYKYYDQVYARPKTYGYTGREYYAGVRVKF